jgi:hypothetical protein
MIVTIGETTLVNGPSREADENSGPLDLRVVGAVATQATRYIRGAHGKVFNRQGHLTTVTFGAVRECADLATAEGFVAEYQAEIVGLEGVCKLGNVEISDSVVESVECSHAGVRVDLLFRIVGGKSEIPEEE